MRGKLKRKFAVVMASVLALSNIQTAPVFAAVEEERTIIRFEELPEKYAVQELELGAAKEDIRFPDSLQALSGDGAQTPHSQSRSGEWLAKNHGVRKSQFQTAGADFIFEKLL